MALDRQARALSQRLLLEPNGVVLIDKDCVMFRIIGSTGKTYDVSVSANTSCTCPDYKNRESPCKHIYFVLNKLLRCSDALWKKGTDFSEIQLREVLSGVYRILDEKWVQETLPKKNHAVEPKVDTCQECPLCLEDFQVGEKMTWCNKQCGYVFHFACFSRCKNKLCPMCRAELNQVDIFEYKSQKT